MSADASSASSSLVSRLRARDAEAWDRFARTYAPLVYGWARTLGLHEDDARETSQDVFQTVHRKIGEFRHDRPEDTFRGWLYTITKNRVRQFWRDNHGVPAAEGGTAQQQRMAEVSAPLSESDIQYSLGERALLVRRALEVVRAEFEPSTWQAFWRVTMEGHSVADVAEELGLKAHSVYQAKSRVLRRLRAELAGFDEGDAS